MEGERNIKLAFDDITVTFSRESTIQFYNKDGELIMSMDPTDLSALYGAHRQMTREYIDLQNHKITKV